MRPSGTEPKLKAYLEVTEPVRRRAPRRGPPPRARMSPLRAAVTELLLAPPADPGIARQPPPRLPGDNIAALTTQPCTTRTCRSGR